MCVAGGLLAAAGIRNPSRQQLKGAAAPTDRFSCALDAAPLVTKT